MAAVIADPKLNADSVGTDGIKSENLGFGPRNMLVQI